MSHKPSIGRIVRYYEGDAEAPLGQQNRYWSGTNGTRYHPAIITRVWSDDCVNLTIFLDHNGVVMRSSAVRLPDEVFADDVHCSNSGWRWPERV